VLNVKVHPGLIVLRESGFRVSYAREVGVRDSRFRGNRCELWMPFISRRLDSARGSARSPPSKPGWACARCGEKARLRVTTHLEIADAIRDKRRSETWVSARQQLDMSPTTRPTAGPAEQTAGLASSHRISPRTIGKRRAHLWL